MRVLKAQRFGRKVSTDKNLRRIGPACIRRPAPAYAAESAGGTDKAREVRAFIITYHPISETAQGRRAVARFGYPPYGDGSCRREPDFGPRYTSISSLCRGPYFVPKLRKGDEILYLTVQGKWGGDRERHWRLVAYLRVIRTFGSHESAADWYRAKGLVVPGNCIVYGSKPLPISRTSGVPKPILAKHPRRTHLRAWDAGYRARAARTPQFVVTRPLHLFLNRPPKVSRKMWELVFERVLNTQSPKKVGRAKLRKLFRISVGRDARA